MGLSFWHILLLTIIILVFFGPSRLPGLGKSLGESIRGFKEGLDGKGEKERDVTHAKKEELDKKDS